MKLLVFSLSSLDPLFQQVLVVTVSSGAEGKHSFVAELTAVGVDEHGHQAVVFPLELVDEPHDLVSNILEE